MGKEKNIFFNKFRVIGVLTCALITTTIERFRSQPQAGLGGALRYAMNQAQANPDWQHPAFWAPFSVIGNNFARNTSLN